MSKALLTFQKISSGLSCLLTSLRPHPLHVQWFITSQCNYRCRCCGVWRYSPTRELNLEGIKRGLEILKEFKVATLVFTGGNPLLHRDMGAILKYARDKFPVVSIYDNGSLAWKRIEELKQADMVCISLHTLKPELQDFLTGIPGSFRAVLRSVKALRKARVNVAVDVTISQLNLEELPHIINFFGSQGIAVIPSLYVEFSPQNSLIKIGYSEEKAHLKNKKHFIRSLETLKQLKHLYPVHLNDESLEAIKRFFSKSQRDWKCKALSSFFVIDPMGRVSGCHLMPPVTNLEKLSTFWRSKIAKKFRARFSTCEGCLFLCYLVYSLLDGPRKLASYALAYELYRLRRILYKSKHLLKS